MFLLQNLDLLSVGFVVAAIAVLGFVLLFSNKRSKTNQTFFLLSVYIVLWSILNYAIFQVKNPVIALWTLRFVMFSAIGFAYFLYKLAYVFPKKEVAFPKYHTLLIKPLVFLTSLLTLTPFLFEKITSFSNEKGIQEVTNGFGIYIFALVAIALLGISVLTFIHKVIKSAGIEKKQFKLVVAGFSITFFLLIIFNFVLPAFWNNTDFIKLGAVFIFPFVVFTSYAILHHRLFNIKVAATALLVFALATATFAEVILTGRDIPLLIFRSSIFIFVLLFGILLIKSVLREVEQRELIEKQEKELEIANDQQTKLIHFITHQVKGFFTKSRNIFASVLEGDYGNFPVESKHILEEGFKSDTKAVQTVQEILNAANIRNGTLAYTMKPVDFKLIITNEIEKVKEIFDTHKIKLETDFKEGDYVVPGDEAQLEHVVRNLFDNCVKYKQPEKKEGHVLIHLEKTSDKVLLTITDDGVGITSEDMRKLFTEGGRGKDSVKVNVDSTGFGLYIVKNIITAHKGTIKAESEGHNKGSRFIIELPVK